MIALMKSRVVAVLLAGAIIMASFAWVGMANAAIVVSDTGELQTSGTTPTATFTVTSGAEYLIVTMPYYANGANTCGTVAPTYNLVSMTEIGAAGGNNDNFGVKIYGLANPASGSHDFVVACSTSAARVGLGWGTLTGIKVASPVGGSAAETNSDASITTTVTGASGIVIDALAFADTTTASATGGQTQIENGTQTTMGRSVAGYVQHTGSNVTSSWSGDTASTDSQYATVEIIAAASVSSTGVPMMMSMGL